MKPILVPVEMIASFSAAGAPTPVRFRITWENADKMTITVCRVIERTETKVAGVRQIHFLCRSAIEGFAKEYEITFELQSLKWWVSKI